MQWKEERIQNGTGLAVFEGGTDGGAGLNNLEVRFGKARVDGCASDNGHRRTSRLL